MPVTEERERGGYDRCLVRWQLKPIFRLLPYGLSGFARSDVDFTSASEENDRDLPPKNLESPGFLHHRTHTRLISNEILSWTPDPSLG